MGSEMCIRDRYKVSSVEVQKISNMFKTEVETEKNKAEVRRA